MTTHTCNARCSWKATPDSLRALGYEIPEGRPDDAAMDKWKLEQAFLNAKHQAWKDGHVNTCSRTDRIWDHEKNRPKV